MKIDARHDLSSAEVETIEDRLYEYNAAATGRHDGEGLAFLAHDDAGAMIGAVAGYTWAGVCEIRQLWVHESQRGAGLGLSLLTAAVDEAARRGAARVWLASYDFQAPGFYEKAGFRRVAELDGFPEGHVNVILCKTLEEPR